MASSRSIAHQASTQEGGSRCPISLTCHLEIKWLVDSRPRDAVTDMAAKVKEQSIAVF